MKVDNIYCSEPFIHVCIENLVNLSTDQVAGKSILNEKGSKIGRLIEADEDFIYGIIYRGSELFKDSFYNFEIDMEG